MYLSYIFSYVFVLIQHTYHIHVCTGLLFDASNCITLHSLLMSKLD